MIGSALGATPVSPDDTGRTALSRLQGLLHKPPFVILTTACGYELVSMRRIEWERPTQPRNPEIYSQVPDHVVNSTRRRVEKKKMPDSSRTPSGESDRLFLEGLAELSANEFYEAQTKFQQSAHLAMHLLPSGDNSREGREGLLWHRSRLLRAIRRREEKRDGT